jgi:hypothetical protein
LLAVFQFPLADLRRFVSDDTHRLAKPAWPFPRPGKDFVRSFGNLCRRPLGGVENWPGEDFYCEAARGLRMADGWQKKVASSSKLDGQVRCAFRRLLSDGLGITRVEVAFDLRESDLLKQVDAVQSLRRFCEIPVQVRQVSSDSSKDRWDPQTLLPLIGSSLARHYLQCTTKREEHAFEPKRWWVQSCEPLLIVQHLQGQLDRLPAACRKVDLSTLDTELRHLRWSFAGDSFSVWLLGFKPGVNKDFARRLRLHVLRLHAEYEILRQTLRSIVERELILAPRTESCDNLQLYLQKSIGLLSKESRFGVRQSDLLKTVVESQDILTPGQKETLLSQTQALRGNIKKAVERFTQSPVPHITFESNYVQIDKFGENDMSDHSISFGDNATVSSSNLTAATKIQSSSIAVNASDATPEIKALLEQLHSAVTEMTRHLAPQEASNAARDLSQFSQEVTAERPRKQWYELSAQGLLEAAKAVGGAALPVVSIVTSILKLFS